MSTVSFARIMYGTNQDLPAVPRATHPGLAANPVFTVDPLESPRRETLSLESLLYKAWLALRPKS